MTSQNLNYTVVVRNPNSWSASTGIREELRNCGHRHKSVGAALKCYESLTAWRDGSTSAAWYHSQVEDSTGRPYDNCGRPQSTRAEERETWNR